MITYITPDDQPIQAPEELSFFIYTLLMSLKKAGAPDDRIKDFERLCREYLNPMSDQDKEIIAQTVLRRFGVVKKSVPVNPLNEEAKLGDKDFLKQFPLKKVFLNILGPVRKNRAFF